MKKNILMAIMAAGALTAMAQSDAQLELQGQIDEGIAKFSTADGNYSFRVGARLAVDGEYNFDDFTDRTSGARLSQARIRVLSKLGKHFDMKLDADFMAKEIIKDAWLRWHTTDNSFLRLGNFAEPFSAENIQSTFDYPFITKSATTQALGTGRALGLSYRYYMPYFWGEAGVFSQKIATDYMPGDMGFSVSARVLGRYTSEDFNIHAGGSFNFRRPNSNGFASGNDDFNRTVTFSSNLCAAVDDTRFLSATMNNVKNYLRFGGEVMANYKNFYLKGEYIGAHVNRARDWETTYMGYIGSVLGTMFKDADALSSFMGGDSPADFSGVMAEVGVIAIGGDYRYNAVEAMMRRPKGKTLEFVARYNYTSLNDYWGMYSVTSGRGNFFDSDMHAAYSMGNQSVAGGKVNAFTFGVNYYITNYIVARLNYTYAHLNREYDFTFKNDRNLHSLQARVAFEF